MHARKENSSVTGATTRLRRPSRVKRGSRSRRGTPSHQSRPSIAIGPANSTAVSARGRATAGSRPLPPQAQQQHQRAAVGVALEHGER